ncbi:hypothetical protein I5907_17875 [Panacibacter sp. DH6]|uniref:Uncharacterized protein n=1 Tax=Panacibacter microcysteis TaxID=2793269 RepID=A0A931MCH2_9BACT|nr:hypothetical protein [Panacibacter microcysteis]MBG9378111.1 hypothetical protein [Panacibacter microcysteis]
MYIHIVHAGETQKAKVVYNFRQVTNMILLKFEVPIKNGLHEIVLTCTDNLWRDDCNIKESDPELFTQLLIKLKSVLQESLRAIQNEYNNM